MISIRGLTFFYCRRKLNRTKPMWTQYRKFYTSIMKTRFHSLHVNMYIVHALSVLHDVRVKCVELTNVHTKNNRSLNYSIWSITLCKQCVKIGLVAQLISSTGNNENKGDEMNYHIHAKFETLRIVSHTGVMEWLSNRSWTFIVIDWLIDTIVYNTQQFELYQCGKRTLNFRSKNFHFLNSGSGLWRIPKNAQNCTRSDWILLGPILLVGSEHSIPKHTLTEVQNIKWLNSKLYIRLWQIPESMILKCLCVSLKNDSALYSAWFFKHV